MPLTPLTSQIYGSETNFGVCLYVSFFVNFKERRRGGFGLKGQNNCSFDKKKYSIG